MPIRYISKVVYNKSAETGLQLAQPSLSLCKLLPLQSLRLTSSCKDRAVAKYCHMELSVWRPNQRKLACGWPRHHYLCANYSPCKPAKFEAHQFLQGQSCCKILSYGVKRMAPKSAEAGLQLAQPSLSLCKLLPLQTCKI